MAIKGIFTSDAGIPGDRTGDFAKALLQVMPTGTAPLLALSSGMPSADAHDTIITWFEENHLSGRVSVTNNAGTGTTVTVDDATQTQPGAIYLVEASGEYLLVTAVVGNDLTVVRGWAGTSITAIDGSSTPAPIQKIGNAQEEASGRPGAIANLGFPRFNYTQTFRNEWNASRTAQQIAFHTGNVVAKNRRDAAMLHSEDIEKTLLYGRKSTGVKNNNPFKTMDGIVTQIVSNLETTSDPTYTDIRNFLQDVFSKNVKGQPNERIAFCGNTVLGVIDTLSMNWGVMNLSPGQTDFGFEIQKWRTPYGTISLMTHPLMNESPLWTQDLYVLHPGVIRTRWLSRTNEDNNDSDGSRAGVDADFGVITSELSVEYKAEKTGGIWTGMQTADTTTL